MNQKDYLKRYLSVDKQKKKSKKKRHDNKGNLKIIDDSIEYEESQPNFEYDEDAPAIVDVSAYADTSNGMSSLSRITTSSMISPSKDSKINEDDSTKGMTVMKRRRLIRSKKLTPEEEDRNEREAVLQKSVNEKHGQWSQGVKQFELTRQRTEDYSLEATKEFARHAHDHDMNERLKNVDREEDPMLEYMNMKNREKVTASMPIYKGSYPPNRYNIRPGYRWDGVDRSNGYEKSLFEKKNSRKAAEEEMYKWSVEDM